jgi:hypothetical protein
MPDPAAPASPPQLRAFNTFSRKHSTAGFFILAELAMPVLRCAGLPHPTARMREHEIQASCTSEFMVSKVQRISAAALGALERRLHEQRLPIEEQAFLAARLEAYRKAAALASGSRCGRADCCMA